MIRFGRLGAAAALAATALLGAAGTASAAPVTPSSYTVYAIRGGNGHGGYITDEGHGNDAELTGTGSHLILVGVGGPWFQIKDIATSLCLTLGPSFFVRFESCASNQYNHWKHGGHGDFLNQAASNQAPGRASLTMLTSRGCSTPSSFLVTSYDQGCLSQWEEIVVGTS